MDGLSDSYSLRRAGKRQGKHVRGYTGSFQPEVAAFRFVAFDFLVFRVDFLVATVFHSPTAPASERMKSESAPGFVTMTPLSNVQRYRPPWPAGWTE